VTKEQKDILRERISKLKNDIKWKQQYILDYLSEIEKLKNETALLEALVQDPKEATA
jgi:hypothetical protein